MKKGVVLSGGRGTRLRPLTYTQSKQLIPVANVPILFYGLRALAQAGIRELALIVGETEPELRQAVGDGARWGFDRLEYIRQPAPLGLAHAIQCARDFVQSDPFIVYLGDNLILQGVASFIQAFENTQPDAMVLLSPVPHPEQFGVAEIQEGKLLRLVEKPQQPKSNLALVGVYLFTPCIFEAIASLSPSWRGEYEITDAIQNLLDSGKKVEYHIISGWWKDTGKVEDLLEANSLLLQDIEPKNLGSVDEFTRLEGKISIGQGTTITSSTLRGPIIIGENCSIHRSYVGPFTSIGNNVVIEESEIENSIILEGAKIIGISRMDSSLVGKECEIVHNTGRPRRMSFVLGDKSIARVL
ncbi:MAG: glucose-1-phosphate thymidylyltransferase [bacterium JZ-2024 1]